MLALFCSRDWGQSLNLRGFWGVLLANCVSGFGRGESRISGTQAS